LGAQFYFDGILAKRILATHLKNAKGKVDEKQQLRNASNYYRKHQDNPNFIARLEKEALKTTFNLRLPILTINTVMILM
jgi:hypothetical protein